jgi:hypothetical protein
MPVQDAKAMTRLLGHVTDPRAQRTALPRRC